MKPFFSHCRYARRIATSCQRGAAAVELAIVLAVLLLLAAGIIEFGRAYWYYNALDRATRDAARYLSALPATTMTSSTNIAAAVTTAQNLAVSAVSDASYGAHISPAITTSNVNVACDAGACNGTKPANVTVSITGFSITLGAWFPFVIGPSGGKYAAFNLSPHTTMRYMN